MPQKLFVGGISRNTGDDLLRETFERFGAVVEATVITDRGTGRSRGFGFVRFADAADSARAIEELDGTRLDGRPIRISEARDSSRGGSDRER